MNRFFGFYIIIVVLCFFHWSASIYSLSNLGSAKLKCERWLARRPGWYAESASVPSERSNINSCCSRMRSCVVGPASLRLSSRPVFVIILMIDVELIILPLVLDLVRGWRLPRSPGISSSCWTMALRRTRLGLFWLNRLLVVFIVVLVLLVQKFVSPVVVAVFILEVAGDCQCRSVRGMWPSRWKDRSKTYGAGFSQFR